MTTPLIIDVDTGIDNSLALLYAAASPEAEIVAVTCVGGNVDARQVERNTRAVLELAGRTDLEVALGRERPLVRPVETTPETHGPQGLGHAELPPPSRPLSDRHAADLFIEEARRRPGEITLVTCGPLTNLAVAMLREPELPTLLKGWVLMGGAYRHPGNTAPTTEWNIHCDPEAASIAFAGWGSRGRARRLAAGRARSRRHREGEDPARARRRPGQGRRKHAGRLDRARPRRGPDAGDAIRREQPRRPVRG